MMSRAEQLLLAMAGSVLERIDINPRPERCLPVPAPFNEGPTGAWLQTMTGGRNELWRHQSLALRQVADGHNVVVSTGTASGKSLIFMATLVHEMLTGTGKALVFYPQKALGGDQFGRFRTALKRAGLDPTLVGMINGDVPTAVRDEILARSRILLVTPDVVQSWLMRQVQAPGIQRFLKELRHVVLDEAHVFEGIFGSTSSFLYRRLRSAHCEATGPQGTLQWIAATATIREPASHLEQLTGCKFAVIGEEDNGAPFYGLTLLHIDGPGYGTGGERLLAEICGGIAAEIAPNALIAFADSRQGVEHVAKYVNRDDVLPYRGGYEAADRQNIEEMLHANMLRGVISTSALELGIDLPQFEVGLNLGIPQTRKALRQRIGRIGRSMPGAFAVIAPASAFAELGGTFREYVESEVEPSRLYLHNRCIQVQAARCLIDECGGSSELGDLPTAVQWPAGFADMFQAAQPGAIRDRDLDQALAMGPDCPHHAYPLRAIRETEFALRNTRNPSERIGVIDLEKALREAYPGATHYHMGKVYRVAEWRMNHYEHSIMLEPAKSRPLTQALLCSKVNVSTASGELIDDHLLEGPKGTFAEVLLKVADSVDGYRMGNVTSWYRDLRLTNWKMTHKLREFASTGVVLRIQEPWFSGQSEHAIKMRQTVAEGLAAVLAREHNIAPSEIRTAHTRIAIYEQNRPRVVDDAIVLFDNVVGGLRLTSPLFTNFADLLHRLDRAVEIAGEKAIMTTDIVRRLREWYGCLSTPSQGAAPAPLIAESGELLIVAPGSIIGVRFRGNLIERKVIAPASARFEDQEMLGYRCESERGGTLWVAHDQVETIGHDWQHALWNPVTNEIRGLAA